MVNRYFHTAYFHKQAEETDGIGFKDGTDPKDGIGLRKESVWEWIRV